MTAQQTTAIPMLRIPRSAHPAPTTPRLRSATVPILAYALAIVTIFAGSILLARDLGWFATTGRGASLSAAEARGSAGGEGTESGEHVAPAAGAVPEDVKGWMTIQQVLDAFPVSKSALYERFGIPADTSTETSLSSLKESGALSGFDVPSLRDWLAEQSAG